MGSDRKRRKSDIANPGIISEKIGDSYLQSDKPLNEKCPVSFRIRLKNIDLPEGLPLYMKIVSQRLTIYSGTTKIQEVNGTKGENLLYCLQNGFSYLGKVKKEFGEFQRTTKS